MSYRKQIISKGNEAKARVMKGADFAADCVKLTIGPYGQNWILPNVKKVSNDGLAVATEIRLDDEIENEGAKGIQKIAQNVADRAGDATSTAAVLSQGILKEARKLLGDPERGIVGKMSPADFRQKLMSEYEIVAGKLKEIAQPITTREQLIESAMVSVENSELAELIGGMQWDMGKDGRIIAETTSKPETTIERVSGFRVENSVASNLLVNNHEKGTLEVEDVGVILTNYNITDMRPLYSLIESLHKAKVKHVVLLARMFSVEVIKKCAENANAGGLPIYPLNAPFGNQVEMLKDIAAVVGGSVCLDEEKELGDILISDVGFARRVVADRNSSIFTADESDRIDLRIEELESKLASGKQSSAFDRAKLEDRIAQLKGGFAILKVGSLSEADKSYKKDKVDDAINAVRHALQEGVVRGGGIELKEIADTLGDGAILKNPLKLVNKSILELAPSDFEIAPWVKDPAKILRIALEEACIGTAVMATVGGVAVFEHDRPNKCHQGDPING